jgi:hypothetical protein
MFQDLKIFVKFIRCDIAGEHQQFLQVVGENMAFKLNRQHQILLNKLVWLKDGLLLI